MKAIGMSAAAVCVLLGIAAPALADDKVAVVKTTDGDRKVIWMKSRAKTWDTEHKTWVVRGGYQGYRVPDDKFSLYFGPEHTFRINSLPYRMVGSEPQFQYNGYWMTVVDPWPESWSDTWYDADDVYVRYDNGYYLYNTRYPDVGLSLRFSNK
jgi:hypothetical protein